MHFSQRCSHLLKALAKSSLVSALQPPPTSSWTRPGSWRAPPALSSAWGRKSSPLGPSQASKGGEESRESNFCKELLNFLHSVHRGVVPVEHPLPGIQIRPFQAESLEKALQGFDDVVSVDSGTPGNVIRVDIVIEESEEHLFRAARSDLGLNQAWCTLFFIATVSTAFLLWECASTQPTRPLRLSCPGSSFPCSGSALQRLPKSQLYGPSAPAKAVRKPIWHSSLPAQDLREEWWKWYQQMYHGLRRKLGDQPPRWRQQQGWERRSGLFFQIWLPLVIGWFALLILLQYLENCSYLEQLVPETVVRKFFHFLCTCTAPEEIRNEVTHSRHDANMRGYLCVCWLQTE